MKLAIVNLTSGGLSGGYLKYLRHLLPLLRADPRVQRLEVFMPPIAIDADTLTCPVNGLHFGFRSVHHRLRQLAPDVVFFPTARWIDCGPIPTVVMLRNMEPLNVPFNRDVFVESVKNLLRTYNAWAACRNANRVIAVSQHVREFLIGRWKISPHKVGVVYHGVEAAPLYAETLKPQSLQGHDLSHFTFTAGSIRPARGLEDAIKSMAIVAKCCPTVKMVIGGESDPGTRPYMKRLQYLADRLGVASCIVWAGQLNSPEMSWCFYHCKAFIVTSRAEACPNTVLEAMNHGCQIVSTRQPPMPEFLCDSAMYYEPTDANDLAAKIRMVMEASQEQQKTYRTAARSRACHFTWADTARKTIDQLELAAHSGSDLEPVRGKVD